MSWTLSTAAGALIYDPRLPDYLLSSAKLTQELNKADTLTFTLKPEQRAANVALVGSAVVGTAIVGEYPRSTVIDRLKSTVIAAYNGTTKSRCRLIDDKLGWHNERECLCEGELAFFNDSIQRPFTFPQDDQHAKPADYLSFLVTRHNAQVSSDRQFTVGNVTVTDPNNYISRSDTEYSTTWTLLNEGLLDTLGGYLWVRHENGVNYLDYLSDFSTLANQPIKAGLNMLGLETKRNGAEIATAILPLGKADEETQQRLTISDIADYTDTDICKSGDIVYSAAAETLYGSRIVKVMRWDDVSIDTNLLTKAIAELAVARQLPSTVTISAADLSAAGYNYNTFSLGTYVQIEDDWHVEHGLSATYLVKKLEIDLLNPANNKLTLGATTLSFTESSKREITAAMQTVETNVTMETAQAVAELERRNQSAIEQSEQSIILTVSENYYTKGETDGIVSAVETTINQTADGIRIDFTNLQQNVQDVQASADAKFNSLQSYIQMAGGTITLGEIGNEVTLKIENDRIGIYVNGVAMTYWTAQDFVAPITLRIPVGGRLILGNFSYIPRSNGSLDFTWIGG